MISVPLNPRRETQLVQIVRANGESAAQLAQRVLEDFVDFQNLPEDADADGAETSVNLAPELFDDEFWNEDEPHGPE